MINKYLNLDGGFHDEELKIFEKLGLPSPSEINQENCEWCFEIVTKNLKKFRSQKGACIRYGGKNKADSIEKLSSLFKIYSDMLKFRKSVINGGGHTKFSKIRPDGRYGELDIHLPSLIGNLVVVATKNGQKVYEKQVDKDTVDLLTKRLDTKRKYSDLAQKIFSDLTTLGNVPKTRNTVKFPTICGCYESEYEDVYRIPN